jgi:hypothetical protein
MAEVVNHKVAGRPPRRFDWSFDMRVFGQEILLKAGAPRGFPPDVRRAQVMQVCLPDGTPKLRPNGKLLSFTYSEVVADLKGLLEDPEPDNGLITAFSAFVSAVERAFPLTLDELVSIYGVQAIAGIMGVSDYSLRNRMSGKVNTKAEELMALRRRFPALDIETTLVQLSQRRGNY